MKTIRVWAAVGGSILPTDYEATYATVTYSGALLVQRDGAAGWVRGWAPGAWVKFEEVSE